MSHPTSHIGQLLETKMFETSSHVLIATPQRYALRLAKHFEHRVPVQREDSVMRISFPDATCELLAANEHLDIHLESASLQALTRCRDVVARHLKQVAPDEEVAFVWTDSEDQSNAAEGLAAEGQSR